MAQRQAMTKSSFILRSVILLGLLGLSWSVVAQEERDCTPSNWGADDEIGNLNLISAETVLKAAKLIETGNVYSLGIIIDSTTPAFGIRKIDVHILQPDQQGGKLALPNSVYNDDLVTGWLGIGSQLDTLGHLGSADGMFYNCNHLEDIGVISGLTKLGVETVPPMVARGIILDMASHFGVDSLEAGQTWTVEDVQAVEQKQGTPVQEGDVVLFHTGWTDAKLASAPDEWVAAEPGQSEEVAHYLASKNVVAVGADTWGLDVVPPPDPDRPFQGHIILLKENGIFILEVMNTGPLVDDDVLEFLFVLGPARLRGAAQMIVNPIAID